MVSSSPTPKVAIEDFGRIDRALFRLCLVREDIQHVAVNHTVLSMEHQLTAIGHDSTHGPCLQALEIIVAPAGHPSLLPATKDNPNPERQRDTAQLDWATANAEYVFESTGKMSTRDKAGVHPQRGAKCVIISAPSKDCPNFVYGVNYATWGPTQSIISNTSCAINCLALNALVFHSAFGIEMGKMTKVHASTSGQKVLDGFSTKDLGQGRSAMGNIIPATTGAAQAVVKVLPELAGKFHGISIRVPVTNVSLVDLTDALSTPVGSKEDMLAVLRETLQRSPKLPSDLPALEGVLAVGDEKFASSDYVPVRETVVHQ